MSRMRHTFVVAEEDVDGQPGRGRHRPREGRPRRPHRLAAARAARHPLRAGPLARRAARKGRDELLFVVSGAGTLELEGEPHELEPDTGRYVRAGETYVIDNEGPDELLLVSTTVPVEQVYRLAAGGDRPLRRPAGAARRREAHVPLPRQPGRRLHGRDPVRRDRRAVPRARPQPLLRRGRLHRRGGGVRAHRGRVDPAPAGIVLPPAAGAGALHREHGAGRDADPRRLPSVGRSGFTRIRGQLGS